jgi:phosphoglycerate dehydrogenase-like enzyme
MTGQSSAPLIISDYAFSEADRERLEARLGPGRLVLVKSNSGLPEALSAHPDADVLCTFFPPADTLERVPGLRWVALTSAGADGAVRANLLRSDGKPVVTTASGVHAVAISEFVFSLLLMWTRHWPRLLEQQRERRWPDRRSWLALQGNELAGATLGIIGLGAIGRQTARLGRAFGMRIIALRRSVREGERDADVDELYPMTGLRDLLAAADYVVVAVPGTDQTRHLIGDEELRAMKSSAFLVNIARGMVIDEEALVAALRDGVIAGAGLDVFEREPLPEDSPLWTMPNVIIAPHLSGNSATYSRRFTDLFLDNIERYRQGLTLRNVVDPTLGY